MKKLLIAFQLIAVSAGAQITFENFYPNGNTGSKMLGGINLSSSGYKYMEGDTSQITIYNLNHTVYRTIPIPNQFGISQATFRILFVSEELFNLNPNDIEYMITYIPATSSIPHTRVYDESGNLLFARDTFLLQTVLGPGVQQNGIFYTSGGVKMILNNGLTGGAAVYSLPGSLPCNECTGGIISGIAPTISSGENQQQQLPNPFPNPTNSTTTISYTLPANVTTGTIVIYDVAGREVKRYSVTNAFTSITLSAEDLANGTYSYTLEAGESILPGRKFVIAK